MKSTTPRRYPTAQFSGTPHTSVPALPWLVLMALACAISAGCADASSGGRTSDDPPAGEVDETGSGDETEESTDDDEKPEDDETPADGDETPPDGDEEPEADEQEPAEDDGSMAGGDVDRPVFDRSCDSIDDDQDGRVDEDFDSPERCSVGEGACRREGRRVCENGRIVCGARSGSPRADTCDGVDNDCDGRVDEGNRGTITLHDTRTPTREFSPRCAAVQPRSPLMYTAVECNVADADCVQTATWGSSTVVWEAEPGVYHPNAFCCEVNVAQCFGESWTCTVGDEAYPCDCTPAWADPIVVEGCTDTEFVACQ